jgi:hydrogenase/urease accessory protein HupE
MKWLSCALAIVSPASAHPVPFSYLDIRITAGAPGGAGGIDATLVAHVTDLAHEIGSFEIAADGRALQGTWSGPETMADPQSRRFQIHYLLDAAPGTITVSALLFPYDPSHQTFLNIYEGGTLRSQSILDRSRTQFEYFAGTRQGIAAVMRKFVPAGIHHILIGPDHLLFLIGLLLLGGSMRRLAAVVTAFTVAHSVTLSLAVLNIVSPPARIIEPAIALSIVYVGVDNLMVRGGRDVRAWIALSFGFIHGFGFANVLREMDLPARALGWSLLSFNAGVELGQLLVVVSVASLLAALRSRSQAFGQRLVFAGSLAVIAAGAFWFVQRVFFPGGIS